MKTGIATALALLLTQFGCTPNATTYYRPSMEGGQVLVRHCVPTESIVEFGALPIQASVIEGHNAWFVVLRLPSKKPPRPTWQTFHFAASDFHIRDHANGLTTPGLPISVLRNDESASVIEPYHSTRPDGWLYTIDVRLPGPPPESFDLLFPPVVIDGTKTLFPPIRFERKMWMGISAFNC